MPRQPIDPAAPNASSTQSEGSTTIQADPGRHSSQQPYLAVVVQGLDDGCTLHLIPKDGKDTGEQIWTRIRHHFFTSSIGAYLWTSLFQLFTSIIVGTAIISHIPYRDGKQTAPATHCDFSIRDFEQDWLLTKAFRRPPILTHFPQHTDFNPHFALTIDPRLTKPLEQKVVVIRRTINKTKVAWLLTILLILSPGLGLVFGLATHKAEVGVAISAGVFTFAAFLQGLAAWFHA